MSKKKDTYRIFVDASEQRSQSGEKTSSWGMTVVHGNKDSQHAEFYYGCVPAPENARLQTSEIYAIKQAIKFVEEKKLFKSHKVKIYTDQNICKHVPLYTPQKVKTLFPRCGIDQKYKVTLEYASDQSKETRMSAPWVNAGMYMSHILADIKKDSSIDDIEDYVIRAVGKRAPQDVSAKEFYHEMLQSTFKPKKLRDDLRERNPIRMTKTEIAAHCVSVSQRLAAQRAALRETTREENRQENTIAQERADRRRELRRIAIETSPITITDEPPAPISNDEKAQICADVRKSLAFDDITVNLSTTAISGNVLSITSPIDHHGMDIPNTADHNRHC